MVTDADRHVLPKTFTVLHENLKDVQNIHVVETETSGASVDLGSQCSTGTLLPPADPAQPPPLPGTTNFATRVVVQEYAWGPACLCPSLNSPTTLGNRRHRLETQPFSEVDFEFKSLTQEEKRQHGMPRITTLVVSQSSSSQGTPLKLPTLSSASELLQTTNTQNQQKEEGDSNNTEKKKVSCTGPYGRCSFDLIIGSDIIYMDSSFPLLLESLKSLSHHRTRIVLAGKFRRSTDLQFFGLAKKAGFAVVHVPLTKIRASLRHLVSEEGIFLYEMYLTAGQQ